MYPNSKFGKFELYSKRDMLQTSKYSAEDTAVAEDPLVMCIHTLLKNFCNTNKVKSVDPDQMLSAKDVLDHELPY